MALSRYYFVTSAQGLLKYPVVETFADLPSPTTNTGRVFLVKTQTGTIFNRKKPGLYRSDGAAWSRLGADAYIKADADARFAQRANNLSDLTDAAAARTNLGVESSADAEAKYLDEANNLSDVADVATARGNLGAAAQADLDSHTGDTTNPHAVTKAQVSLGNVINVLQVENAGGATSIEVGPGSALPAAGTSGRLFIETDGLKRTLRDTGTVWTEQSRDPVQIGAGDLGFDPATQTELDGHTGNVSNPHAVTKSQVGLGNVPNVDATVAANVVIADTAGLFAATDVEGALEEENNARVAHEGDTANPHSVTKSQVGLGNVPNEDATVAANVNIVDAGGNFAATEVEGALAEEADARQAHEALTSNPHAVTKSQVGLGNVANATTTISTSAPSGGVDGDIWFQV